MNEIHTELLTKRHGATLALDALSLDVRAGKTRPGWRMTAPLRPVRHRPTVLIAGGEEQLLDRPAEELGEPLDTDETQDVVMLLLEMADASAARGEYAYALKCLASAEDIGGPLAEVRQIERRRWEVAAGRHRSGSPLTVR